MDAKVPEFKDFWKEYPPRWRERKKIWVKADPFTAEIEWMKLSDEEKIAAMVAVGLVERGGFTPDARKWLKHKLFLSEVVAGDEPSSSATKPKLLPIVGKICSIGDCKLPAVYKDTSGSYDHYRCVKHLPTEVREMYG